MKLKRGHKYRHTSHKGYVYLGCGIRHEPLVGLVIIKVPKRDRKWGYGYLGALVNPANLSEVFVSGLRKVSR